MAQVTVSGAVARIIDGYGFKLVETSTILSGKEIKTWYTVWSTEKVQTGDAVTVVGRLSTKLEDFTGRDNEPKTAVAIHINDAKVISADVPF